MPAHHLCGDPPVPPSPRTPLLPLPQNAQALHGRAKDHLIGGIGRSQTPVPRQAFSQHDQMRASGSQASPRTEEFLGAIPGSSFGIPHRNDSACLTASLALVMGTNWSLVGSAQQYQGSFKYGTPFTAP